MCQGLSDGKEPVLRRVMCRRWEEQQMPRSWGWDCACCVPGAARRILGLVMGAEDNDGRRHERWGAVSRRALSVTVAARRGVPRYPLKSEPAISTARLGDNL